MFKQVNALDALEVAKLLGLTPVSKKGRKFPCLGCKSSDAMEAYESGFYCFSCHKRWSNIDAAITRLKLRPLEACQYLADGLGVQRYESSYSSRAAAIPSPIQKSNIELDAYETLRDEGIVPSLPSTLQRDILNSLSLTQSGAEYLNRRALNPEKCEAYGIRSMDRNAWLTLRQFLRENWLPEEISAAGWNFIPWRGRIPALVIPYYADNQVIGLRFRALVDADPKYHSLIGQKLSLPFNSAILHHTTVTELHITEGELDALTLHLAGIHAIGLSGGISTTTLENLALMVQDVTRLIIWRDRDEAGQQQSNRVCDVLRQAHGKDWLQERARIRHLKDAKDINELAQQGRLEEVCHHI